MPNANVRFHTCGTFHITDVKCSVLCRMRTAPVTHSEKPLFAFTLVVILTPWVWKYMFLFGMRAAPVIQFGKNHTFVVNGSAVENCKTHFTSEKPHLWSILYPYCESVRSWRSNHHHQLHLWFISHRDCDERCFFMNLLLEKLHLGIFLHLWLEFILFRLSF